MLRSVLLNETTSLIFLNKSSGICTKLSPIYDDNVSVSTQTSVSVPINLTTTRKTKEWIYNELKEQNVNISDVLGASIINDKLKIVETI